MPSEFAVQVVAEPVRRERIEDQIALVGNLAADEAVEIKNQIAGLIAEIGFEEGQKVSKGDMIFKIDDRKISATLAQAEANAGLAQTTFERMASLIEAGAISQQEFDQAKSDLEAKKAEVDLIKAQLKETVVSAPFDGVMGERRVSLGQYVDQGTTLSFVVSQDPMKAEFHVPERFLGQLEKAQSIKVTVAAYPTETFEGRVYFISPQVDQETRTALVKAKIPNPSGKLRQGMFANLNLIVDVRSSAVTVPETALIPKAEEIFVYVVDKENKAQIKTVKVGLRLAGRAEILEGLAPDEMVIVEGYQKIGPGTPVQIRKDKPVEDQGPST